MGWVDGWGFAIRLSVYLFLVSLVLRYLYLTVLAPPSFPLALLEV